MKNVLPIAVCIAIAICIGTFACIKLLSGKKAAPPAARETVAAATEPEDTPVKPGRKMPSMTMGAVLKRYQPLAKKSDPLAMEICRFAYYDLTQYNEGDACISNGKATSRNATPGVSVANDVFNSDQPFFVFIQGFCLSRGLGVEVDDARAYEKFNAAFELPYAQVEAARCLLAGRGVEANPEKGLEMLEALAPSLRLDVIHRRQSVRTALANDNGYFKTNGGQQNARASLANDDGYFRTVIGVDALDAGKFPPAAIALGDSLRDGVGMAKNNAKALECYIATSLVGLRSSDERIQSLFALAKKEAEEDSIRRLEEYSRSPEFISEIKTYQNKNVQLKSMPEVLAAETTRFKARQLELKRESMVVESLRASGWLTFNNFKRGVSIIRYEVDRGLYIDMATEYLSRYYRMGGVFPQDIKRNAESLARMISSLAEVAAASGNQRDTLSLKALELSLSAKLSQDWQSGRKELESTITSLVDINESSPSPETVVVENYALRHQSDILAQDNETLKKKIETLDADTEIRKLQWVRTADKTFTGIASQGILFPQEIVNESKSQNAEPPIGYENVVRLETSGVDKAKDDAGACYAWINGGEARKYSIAEFSVIRKQCETYIKEKNALVTLFRQTEKRIAWNGSRKNRNAMLLDEMFKEKKQTVADSEKLKDEKYGVELK